MALAALACGPIEYISHVTRRAATEVEDAKRARADQLAPYQYTLAVEYLRRARKEGARSNFQTANRYGRKAAAAAEEAKTLAVARAADPERARRELPPTKAPAQKTKEREPAGNEQREELNGSSEVPDLLGGEE